jgi:hypothetical protein
VDGEAGFVVRVGDVSRKKLVITCSVLKSEIRIPRLLNSASEGTGDTGQKLQKGGGRTRRHK